MKRGGYKKRLILTVSIAFSVLYKINISGWSYLIKALNRIPSLYQLKNLKKLVELVREIMTELNCVRICGFVKIKTLHEIRLIALDLHFRQRGELNLGLLLPR